MTHSEVGFSYFSPWCTVAERDWAAHSWSPNYYKNSATRNHTRWDSLFSSLSFLSFIYFSVFFFVVVLLLNNRREIEDNPPPSPISCFFSKEKWQFEIARGKDTRDYNETTADANPQQSVFFCFVFFFYFVLCVLQMILDVAEL